MNRLPLFPLDVVLFPGNLIPLHIFEPRYRRMVARCLERDRRFGLVYHDSDRLGPFLMEEGRVGALAEIERHQGLKDGRSLILVKGVGRIAIHDGLESGEPYYEAVVAELRDDSGAGPDLPQRRQASVTLFKAALAALQRPPSTTLELDPAGEVSFPLAAVVQADPMWQQALLEMRDEESRLDRLDAVFEQIIARRSPAPEE